MIGSSRLLRTSISPQIILASRPILPLRLTSLLSETNAKFPSSVLAQLRSVSDGSQEAKTAIMLLSKTFLHVPSWTCNVLSDTYFKPVAMFEHTWTDFGVSFMKNDDGTMKYRGFTENICGLERLVLAKELCRRTPILEDKDRQVFSVNVTCPQGQRDRYATYLRSESEKQIKGEANQDGSKAERD